MMLLCTAAFVFTWQSSTQSHHTLLVTRRQSKRNPAPATLGMRSAAKRVWRRVRSKSVDASPPSQAVEVTSVSLADTLAVLPATDTPTDDSKRAATSVSLDDTLAVPPTAEATLTWANQPATPTESRAVQAVRSNVTDTSEERTPWVRGLTDWDILRYVRACAKELPAASEVDVQKAA